MSQQTGTRRYAYTMKRYIKVLGATKSVLDGGYLCRSILMSSPHSRMSQHARYLTRGATRLWGARSCSWVASAVWQQAPRVPQQALTELGSAARAARASNVAG